MLSDGAVKFVKLICQQFKSPTRIRCVLALDNIWSCSISKCTLSMWFVDVVLDDWPHDVQWLLSTTRWLVTQQAICSISYFFRFHITVSWTRYAFASPHFLPPFTPHNFSSVTCILQASLSIFFGSCNLLYALFIFKQVRHTCCLSLHMYVHCIACNYIFLYDPRWISSNAWALWLSNTCRSRRNRI